jgi:hypothetical protein
MSADVTAAQLVVDRQIEHGEVPSTAFDFEFSFGSTRRVWSAAAAQVSFRDHCGPGIRLGRKRPVAIGPYSDIRGICLRVSRRSNLRNVHGLRHSIRNDDLKNRSHSPGNEKSFEMDQSRPVADK